MRKAIIALLALAGISEAGDREDRLLANARALPDVRPELVEPAVQAALMAETEEVPAELLISIAWGESRLDPGVRYGHVCGIGQVNPTDIGEPKSRCRVWDHSALEGFRAVVKELTMMLRDSRVQGSLRRALLYRACGNSAFTGQCRKGKWPSWVLRRMGRLYEAPEA